MDDKMFTKEMLKEFYKNYPHLDDRLVNCPFYVEKTYHHECCVTLFPGWARKYYNSEDEEHEGCPCMKMSQSYVRRKARAFVKKK